MTKVESITPRLTVFQAIFSEAKPKTESDIVEVMDVKKTEPSKKKFLKIGYRTPQGRGPNITAGYLCCPGNSDTIKQLKGRMGTVNCLDHTAETSVRL